MIKNKPMYRFTQRSLPLDLPLLGLLLLLILFGLVILYSASNENLSMVFRQALRLGMALVAMTAFAFIPPHKYKVWAPWLYGIGLSLLLAVMIMGKIGKGAQRWLDLGLFRFQPSEIMKLAVPMMAAWYLDRSKYPIDIKYFLITGLLIFVPAILIAKQPDLGTAIMVSASGLCVIFMAGIPLRIIVISGLALILAAPLGWHVLHDYQ